MTDLLYIFAINHLQKIEVRAIRSFFPEHTRSLDGGSAKIAPETPSFPEHTRSLSHEVIALNSNVFRSIPVHFSTKFRNLCQNIKSKGYMAGKATKMSKIKQVLLLHAEGYSNRKIAAELQLNKGTVNEYMKFVKDHHLDISELTAKEDPELDRIFHAGSPAYTDKRMNDFLDELPMLRSELEDKHVTRYLLWQEYKGRHPDGYGKSQFFFHLKQNNLAESTASKAVLAETYVPGQKLFVDFAGDRLSYVDEDTGEMVPVEVFVASMPYSDYGYVLCVPSQKKEDFVFAIRRCLEYLGGVPPILVPDNLKSAVNKPHRYEPEINATLEDMGNHYGFVVVPCQVRKPTQKSLVENHVKIAYRHIYAKLRGRVFFSLHELNSAVFTLLEEHNRTRMQKRPYSREENFHANEKPLLKPLPDTEYEIREHATLTVQPNCCVELRRDNVIRHYSVPYVYVGRKAEVIFDRKHVYIYIDGKCVATHDRAFQYGYSKDDSHFASNNNVQMTKCAALYIERAARISGVFKTYVERIFDKNRTSNPEEVYYKTCDMLFGLYRRHQDDYDCFNETCRLCLEYGIYTGKRFEAVLRNTLLLPSDVHTVDAPTPTNHENMRGASYFK